MKAALKEKTDGEESNTKLWSFFWMVFGRNAKSIDFEWNINSSGVKQLKLGQHHQNLMRKEEIKWIIGPHLCISPPIYEMGLINKMKTVTSRKLYSYAPIIPLLSPTHRKRRTHYRQLLSLHRPSSRTLSQSQTYLFRSKRPPHLHDLHSSKKGQKQKMLRLAGSQTIPALSR